MERWRRLARRMLRTLGPVAVLVGGFTGSGLAVHAARDWHRHGHAGHGYFHLHVHLGEHRHGGSGSGSRAPELLSVHRSGEHHRRGEREATTPHGSASTAPVPADPPRRRDDGADPPVEVLTVVQAVHQLPPPAPEVDEPAWCRRADSGGTGRGPDLPAPARTADPRAPPA